LRVKDSFAEAMGGVRRELLPDDEEPAERWTAALVTAEIVREGRLSR
jgi:hypothetical protein